MALLKVSEVANQLKVTPEIVYRWIRSGRIAGVHIGERLVRVDEKELELFLSRERRRRGDS